MDPIVPLSFSHDLTNGAPEHASQRGRAAFNNGDIQAKITADRGSFTADKAAASDQNMPGLGRQASRYLAGMIAIAQNEDAIECGLLGIVPGAGARAIDMTGYAFPPSVSLPLPHHPDLSGLPGPDKLLPRVPHPSAALRRALDHTLMPLHYGNEKRQEPQNSTDHNSDNG